MLFEVTQQTIDAIIQAQGCRQEHPRQRFPRTAQPALSRASLKPDWCQFPPGSSEGMPIPAGLPAWRERP